MPAAGALLEVVLIDERAHDARVRLRPADQRLAFDATGRGIQHGKHSRF
jgi:hypothetical protein